MTRIDEGKVSYCDLCEQAKSNKRTGICAVCTKNITYVSHFKVSDGTKKMMDVLGITLQDVLKNEKELAE